MINIRVLLIIRVLIILKYVGGLDFECYIYIYIYIYIVGGQNSSSNLFLGSEPHVWALVWLGRKRGKRHRIYRGSANEPTST